MKKYNFIFLIITIMSVSSIYIITKENYSGDIKELNYSNIDIPNKKTFYIDNIDDNGKDIIISGWFADIGQDNKYINRKYVLIEEKSKKAYIVDSAKTNRPDITTYFNDGFNYDNTGLIGKISKKSINSNLEYRLAILNIFQDGQEEIILTDEYIKF